MVLQWIWIKEGQAADCCSCAKECWWQESHLAQSLQTNKISCSYTNKPHPALQHGEPSTVTFWSAGSGLFLEHTAIKQKIINQYRQPATTSPLSVCLFAGQRGKHTKLSLISFSPLRPPLLSSQHATSESLWAAEFNRCEHRKWTFEVHKDVP